MNRALLDQRPEQVATNIFWYVEEPGSLRHGQCESWDVPKLLTESRDEHLEPRSLSMRF
jgi:hypothetical protein